MAGPLLLYLKQKDTIAEALNEGHIFVSTYFRSEFAAKGDFGINEGSRLISQVTVLRENIFYSSKYPFI